MRKIDERITIASLAKSLDLHTTGKEIDSDIQRLGISNWVRRQVFGAINRYGFVSASQRDGGKDKIGRYMLVSVLAKRLLDCSTEAIANKTLADCYENSTVYWTRLFFHELAIEFLRNIASPEFLIVDCNQQLIDLLDDYVRNSTYAVAADGADHIKSGLGTAQSVSAIMVGAIDYLLDTKFVALERDKLVIDIYENSWGLLDRLALLYILDVIAVHDMEDNNIAEVIDFLDFKLEKVGGSYRLESDFFKGGVSILNWDFGPLIGCPARYLGTIKRIFEMNVDYMRRCLAAKAAASLGAS